jgi:hypothetical protein
MHWPRIWKRKQRDAELSRELEIHLAHEFDDNLAAGMNADEARRAAISKLGNRTLVREDVYSMNTGSLASLSARSAYLNSTVAIGKPADRGAACAR